MRRLILRMASAGEMHVRELVKRELAIDLGRADGGIGIGTSIPIELFDLGNTLVAGVRRHRIAIPPAAGHERQARVRDAGQQSVAEALVYVSNRIQLAADVAAID